MAQRVAVVDYGLNNLDSVCRALEECGAQPFVTDGPAELRRADRIVLPGVGAFPDAMANLTAAGLAEGLRSEVAAGAPLLGICLGMQLLATTGFEVVEAAGLGCVPAQVRRLQPTADDPRIPHVGWNEVLPVNGAAGLFDGIPAGADFYFVHSFHVLCDDDADVVATTPYCGGFASAVVHGNVVGVQFHPEKSQVHGFQLLRNFLAWEPAC